MFRQQRPGVTTINSNSRTGSGRPAPKFGESEDLYPTSQLAVRVRGLLCQTLRPRSSERSAMNAWRCALSVSPKPDESAGRRRTGAAGRPKALCSRMPILPWTQTRRNRQGTPAGQCRRVPSPPGCPLLGPATRIPSSGHAVFCSSARTGAVAGHHFSSGGQRNISCNSIVVSASCLPSKPGV